VVYLGSGKEPEKNKIAPLFPLYKIFAKNKKTYAKNAE
jgi:hypothetical protein